MRKLLGVVRAVLGLAAPLVGALLVVTTLVGAALPRSHRLTRQAVYPHPPAAVWAAVGDVAGYPSWVPRVERIDRLSGPGGRVLWRETNVYGQVTYEEVERVPGRRLVLRIADRGVPYGGTWIYALAPARGDGTRVAVTEDGWVSNPFFRFLARFVFGYGEAVDLYLSALGERLAGREAPAAAPASDRSLAWPPFDRLEPAR